MTTKIKVAMTKKLVTINCEASLSEANQLMKEKRIRHLLVVDSATEEAVGVLSDRQLPLMKFSPQMPVEWAMTTPIISVDQELPLRSAIFKMLENKISSLIIANQSGEVTGIVTTDDLLWYLTEVLKAEPSETPILTADTKITLGELMNQISMAGI